MLFIHKCIHIKPILKYVILFSRNMKKIIAPMRDVMHQVSFYSHFKPYYCMGRNPIYFTLLYYVNSSDEQSPYIHICFIALSATDGLSWYK